MTKNMRKKLATIILVMALFATLVGKGGFSKKVAVIDPPGEGKIVAVIDPPGEGIVNPQVNPQVIDPPGE